MPSYDSDSSSYYSTTYSEDERIAEYVQEQRDLRTQQAKEKDERRKEQFEEYYQSNKDDEDSIFQLAGITFLHFGHKRIKFTFHPWLVATKLVHEKIAFYVSLHHGPGGHDYWFVKRDTIPVNYKQRVYRLLFIDRLDKDGVIEDCIRSIWAILVRWTKKFEKSQVNLRERWAAGEDVYLTESDEELFMTDEERAEVRAKREAIWRRMLPPSKKKPQRLRERRKCV